MNFRDELTEGADQYAIVKKGSTVKVKATGVEMPQKLKQDSLYKVRAKDNGEDVGGGFVLVVDENRDEVLINVKDIADWGKWSTVQSKVKGY